MSFRDTVDRVIELGDAVRTRSGRRPNVHEMDPSDLEWDRPSPEKTALRDYLGGLPPDDIYRLAALMALGREDFPATEFETRVRARRAAYPQLDWVVAQLVEQFPLPNYLRDGLEFLARSGIPLAAEPALA